MSLHGRQVVPAATCAYVGNSIGENNPKISKEIENLVRDQSSLTPGDKKIEKEDNQADG